MKSAVKEDLVLGGGDKPFSVYDTGSKFQTFSVRLSHEVEDQVGKYSDLLNFFEQANETDIINIHLSNYGGCVHTGFALCHAIKNTQASTAIIVDSSSYSMGAILALCGNQLLMRPKAFLMFHNYSGGSEGKGGEMLMQSKHFDQYMHETLEHLCYPFLTKKELRRIRNDQDVYIHAEDKDLAKRHLRHFKRDMLK